MRPVIGITIGDPAGVGSEITVKALKHRDIYEKCLPVVIGDREALLQANEFSGTGLTLCEIKKTGDAKGEYGVLEYIDMGFLNPGS
ncbi:MAG: 4-hydroxythreonine-4-phosphate dehydrogenase PdxA, partial [Synergistaceae bacterium]|nr:4-hydroxythreonine-4-phosphate dehydrogenase PdxA [Synergistaceae bacterium]